MQESDSPAHSREINRQFARLRLPEILEGGVASFLHKFVDLI